MTPAPESVIICEGFHDRAFLRSWLASRGCESLVNKPYRDGKPIRGAGQYAFRTPNGGWLRVVPVNGDANIALEADTYVEKSKTSPTSRIVLVYDEDAPDEEVGSDRRRASFRSWAERRGALVVSDAEDLELAGGITSTRLSLIVWRAPDPPSALLPPRQTLERLVCAALADIYPARLKAVTAWLASRPDPPAGERMHKTHAASHMAGWWSDRGYEGVFDVVWEDERVRGALVKRLEEVGAARVIDALLTSPSQHRGK